MGFPNQDVVPKQNPEPRYEPAAAYGVNTTVIRNNKQKRQLEAESVYPSALCFCVTRSAAGRLLGADTC